MVVLNFITSFFRVKAQQQGVVGFLTTKKRKEREFSQQLK
jgi:hypothetical protein